MASVVTKYERKMSKYGPAKSLLSRVDVDDLIVFLDKLNKDRAEGRRLPHMKDFDMEMEQIKGNPKVCSCCKTKYPPSSKYFHKKGSQHRLDSICKKCARKQNKIKYLLRKQRLSADV